MGVSQKVQFIKNLSVTVSQPAPVWPIVSYKDGDLCNNGLTAGHLLNKKERPIGLSLAFRKST